MRQKCADQEVKVVFKKIKQGPKAKDKVSFFFQAFISLSSFSVDVTGHVMWHGGGAGEEQQCVGNRGESRLAAVLISPFGAKMCLPRGGLSVLGWLTRNQVPPPTRYLALLIVLTFTQEQDTHRHIHTVIYTTLHYRCIVNGQRTTCENAEQQYSHTDTL